MMHAGHSCLDADRLPPGPGDGAPSTASKHPVVRWPPCRPGMHFPRFDQAGSMASGHAVAATETISSGAPAAGGGRRRGGGPGRPAAHPRPGPALRDGLRRAAAGAAHLPRGTRDRGPVPGGAAAGTARRAGLAGRAVRPGDDSLGRDATTRTRWSRAARPGLLGGPGRPDVGHDGAPLPRRAARGPAGPGQRGAARPAVAQEPGRGGRAPARPGRPSTGCTPRCRAGCGRAGPSWRSRRTSPPRSSRKATPGRTS